MGYASSNSTVAFERILSRAVRGARPLQDGPQRAVEVNGALRLIYSFVGPVSVAKDGVVVCTHYGRRIFAVDTARKLMTNFGMGDYSPTTHVHVGIWADILEEAFQGFIPEYTKYHYYRWVERDVHQDPFAQGVPFCVRRDGVNWFHWPSYDEALVEQRNEGLRWLQKDNNWRYYEYAWDEAGKWSGRFKNADAERRWNQRNRFRARKAA